MNLTPFRTAGGQARVRSMTSRETLWRVRWNLLELTDSQSTPNRGAAMPEVSRRVLVTVIQAVDAEIRRPRGLPCELVVPGDEVLLVNFEDAADGLEEAYEVAMRDCSNLPPYFQHVRRSNG